MKHDVEIVNDDGLGIAETLVERISSRLDLKEVRELCGCDYVVAGGALLAASPKDYDLYPAPGCSFDNAEIGFRCLHKRMTVTCESRNALTVTGSDGKILQFCNYTADSVADLITSFDFAHCQVAVHVTFKPGLPPLKRAYYTNAYLRAMATQSTFFTGSEYPLSSLIRLSKYAARGLVGSRARCADETLKILTEFVKRGFNSYDDFKDQLDAVDLAYTGKAGRALWEQVRARLMNGEEE